MGNLFVALPVPPGNGVGAPVNTAGMGRIKTVTVENTFDGSLLIEVSVGGVFSQVAVFTQPGKKILEVAAEEIRVRREGTVIGSPAVSVSANDFGARFANLPVPPGNGTGASVDVSTLGTFNTIVVGNTFTGSLHIEISEDNVVWTNCMTFTGPDNKSKEFTAHYMRVRRVGVVPLIPGSPVVDVGAINDESSGTDSDEVTQLVYRPGSGATGPVIFDTWAGLMTQLTVVRARNGATVPVRIIIDDADVSPAVIPAGGPYDMINCVLAGLRRAGGAGISQAQVVEGATFTNLRIIEDLVVDCAATVTVPCTDLVDGDGIFIRGFIADVSSSAGVPFWDDTNLQAGDSFTIQLLQSASLGFTGGPVIDITVAGVTALLFVYENAIWEPDSIQTAVGTTLLYLFEGGAQISALNQAAAAGAVTQFAGIGPRLVYNPVPGDAPIVAPTTINLDTVALLDTTGGSFAVTLQNLPNVNYDGSGRLVVLKEISNTNPFFVTPFAGDTIDGVAATISVPAGGCAILSTDGAGGNWDVLNVFVSLDDKYDLFSPPEKWVQQNVAAGQSNVDLNALVSTSFDTIKAIRPGSITGLSTRFTQAITDGTADSCIVRVTINGAPGTLYLTHNSGLNASGGEITQQHGVDTFVAGDLIGIEITTLGSFAPATTDLEAWLDMQF